MLANDAERRRKVVRVRHRVDVLDAQDRQMIFRVVNPENVVQEVTEHQIPVVFRGVGKRRVGDNPKGAALENVGKTQRARASGGRQHFRSRIV